MIARQHLHSAPCPTTPAAAGVAGVNANPHDVHLGDWVLVSVCDLGTFVKAAEAAQQPVTLFINGVDSRSRLAGIDLEGGTATFVLDRNAENKDLWQPLLYDPLFDPITTLWLSVGIRGGTPIPRVEGADLSVRLNKLFLDWRTGVWVALLVGVALALWQYARRTDMLRDGPSVGGTLQAFSLGRSQMAWWFFLVLVGYVFIWLVTGDRDALPPSLLALMGISAATALAAAAISPEGGRLGARRKLLEDEIAATDKALQQITVDLAESDTRPAATGTALRPLLEKKRGELERSRAALVAERAGITTLVPSSGLWKDLVTDDRGSVALDRFQIVAWTVVLGGVFLDSVVWDLTMPEFNATLLALMGISSGTYIGFKLPQK
jgi:hypothetical protein